MNLYEILGKIEIKKQKVESLNKEIGKLYERASFVMKDPGAAGMKTVEFLRTEAERLESLISKRTILEGEIQALYEQSKLMPKEEE